VRKRANRTNRARTDPQTTPPPIDCKTAASLNSSSSISTDFATLPSTNQPRPASFETNDLLAKCDIVKKDEQNCDIYKPISNCSSDFVRSITPANLQDDRSTAAGLTDSVVDPVSPSSASHTSRATDDELKANDDPARLESDQRTLSNDSTSVECIDRAESSCSKDMSHRLPVGTAGPTALHSSTNASSSSSSSSSSGSIGTVGPLSSHAQIAHSAASASRNSSALNAAALPPSMHHLQSAYASYNHNLRAGTPSMSNNGANNSNHLAAAAAAAAAAQLTPSAYELLWAQKYANQTVASSATSIAASSHSMSAQQLSNSSPIVSNAIMNGGRDTPLQLTTSGSNGATVSNPWFLARYQETLEREKQRLER
jgi:hypothetical protein